MITPTQNPHMVRVTVTLDPIDVALLDRLASLEGLNRSAELRSLLVQIRPMIRQTVEAFEAANRSRDTLSAAAAGASISAMQELLPEAERLQNAYLGVLARLEGLAAVSGIENDDEAPASNTGATT